MNTTKKMTSRIALTYVMENCTLPEDVSAKLTAMLEALDKKSSGEKKLTPTQQENIGIKEIIVANLPTEPTTVTDIIKSIPELDNDLSTQRVTPILRALVEEGRAKVTTIKGRNHYSK